MYSPVQLRCLTCILQRQRSKLYLSEKNSTVGYNMRGFSCSKTRKVIKSSTTLCNIIKPENKSHNIRHAHCNGCGGSFYALVMYLRRYFTFGGGVRVLHTFCVGCRTLSFQLIKNNNQRKTNTSRLIICFCFAVCTIGLYNYLLHFQISSIYFSFLANVVRSSSVRLSSVCL